MLDKCLIFIESELGPVLSKGTRGTCLGPCGEKKFYVKKGSIIVNKWSMIGTQKKVDKRIK